MPNFKEPLSLDIQDQNQNAAWPFQQWTSRSFFGRSAGPWPLKHHCWRWVQTKRESVPVAPKLAENSIHEDGRALHQGCCPQTVLAPALWQNLLLDRHDVFCLGVINSSCQFSSKLSVEAKRLYKKAYLYHPKRNAYKDTYSIKYIVFLVSDKVTQQVESFKNFSQ